MSMTQKAEAFGKTYLTHTSIQFGDYDESSEVQRANVLFLLREVTGLWAGEIEYRPQSDKVMLHGVEPHDHQLSFRKHGIMWTGCHPIDHPEELADAWSGDPPLAILYTYTHGMVLFVEETALGGVGMEPELHATNDSLCGDTRDEVTILLRDSAWKTTVKSDLEAAIVRLWKTDKQAHIKLCGNHVVHTGQGDGMCMIPYGALTQAFWEYAKTLPGMGHFENTAWAGFDIDAAARAVADSVTSQKAPASRGN